MNHTDIYRFFNYEPAFTKNSPEELIVSILKEKFGFPISYTPEAMDEPLILTTEETLAIYKDLSEKTQNNKFENCILLAIELSRKLGKLYDQSLDAV